MLDKYFSHIHRVFHTICPEWPACHPQGGGWQATRPVSRVKWLWRRRQTRRNGNVARLDSSNFPTFTSEKYLFGTYRRKIINIYCPLVTEKSTNPRVKLTCPCLGKPRHGLSKFDIRVSWFLSHHRTLSRHQLASANRVTALTSRDGILWVQGVPNVKNW